MQTDTACGECGELIYNEDTANRKPCPKCGSTKRKYCLTFTASVSVSATATAQVFRPASAFLDIAKVLAGTDDRMAWNLSVAATLVACEVAAERTIVRVAKTKKQEAVVASMRAGNRTFKMQDQKTREVYAQLTGDDIEQPAEEWKKYIAAKDLRNAIVHEGRQSTKEEAEDVLKTGAAFVRRLEKHSPTP